jgi:hypothetical protein
LPGNTFELKEMALRNGKEITNGGAVFVEGNLILENMMFYNNFQGGYRRSMTISGAGSLELRGDVQMNQ